MESISSSTTSGGGSVSPTTTSTPSSSSLLPLSQAPAALVGIIVGSIAAFILLLLILFYFFLRRRRRTSDAGGKHVHHDSFGLVAPPPTALAIAVRGLRVQDNDVESLVPVDCFNGMKGVNEEEQEAALSLPPPSSYESQQQQDHQQPHILLQMSNPNSAAASPFSSAPAESPSYTYTPKRKSVHFAPDHQASINNTQQEQQKHYQQHKEPHHHNTIRVPDDDDEDFYDLSTFIPPLPTSHVVTTPYIPAFPDELRLQLGDLLAIEKEYSDGWARGQMVVGRARGFYPIICTSPIKSGPSQRTVHVTPSSIDFSDSRPSSSASSASATSSSSVFASWLKRDTGRHQQQQKQQQPQKQTSRLATQVVTINDANAQVEEEEDGASIASSTDCDRRRRSLHNIRKSIPPRSDSTLRWSNGVTMIEKQQHQQLRVDDDNDDEVMMNDQVAREGDVSTSSSIATADMKYPDLAAAEAASTKANNAETGEIPFHVLTKGRAGKAEFVARHSLFGMNNSTNDLPVGLGFHEKPSALSLAAWLESRYLLPDRTMKNLLHHVTDDSILHHQPLPAPIDLLNLQLTSNKTDIEFRRHLMTGTVTLDEFDEIITIEDESNSKNSTSMSRAPAAFSDFVRGKATNYPFFPGGMEDIALHDLNGDKNAHTIDVELEELLGIVCNDDDEGGGGSSTLFMTVPPGFDRGMHFHSTAATTTTSTSTSSTSTGSTATTTHTASVNVLDVFASSAVDEDLLEMLAGAPLAEQLANTRLNNSVSPTTTETKIITSEQHAQEIDKLLPSTTTTINTITNPSSKRNMAPSLKEWAHVIDVNLPFPDFHSLVPDMAFQYPFELDVFQKQAVFHLEQGDSVFVAAHTSAGKTVVAEYAIALAAKHMTRAIYTSPIKALSNQKFRDFKNTFKDVGILTGDVQINPEASCLVMTTEILRSMLYRGADLIRDVEFVVFDEVHYINDADRGVVWEEVIIMLPSTVTLILLSATVPNTKEFADWVGRTKKKNIYVISTPKRPVPLEHYLYADKEIYKVVDSAKRFLSLGYKKAYDVLNAKNQKQIPAKDNNNNSSRGGGGGGGQRGGRGGQQRGGGNVGNRSAPSGRAMDKADKNFYVHMVGLLKKKNLLPVIVFTFSKRKCEEYADALTNIDLSNGASEKSEIHVFCEKSLSRLKGTDRELPQVMRTRELLSRGIAVHHSGLLPIIKEMVEILFTKGLVKMLFATETFAMGVNAPAKAVVFSSIRKHDGSQFRDLLPGEYTQMSGRAGRRGLDETGMVILSCSDDVPDQPTLHKTLLGVPTKLESQFRLTYNMILSLLRVEALKIEDMIKRSFSENSSQKLLPEQQKKLAESSKTLESIKHLSCTICDSDINPYYECSSRIMLLNHFLRERIVSSPVGSKALSCGRVAIINNMFYRNAIAVILKSESGGISGRGSTGQRGVGGGTSAASFGSSSSNDIAYQVFILTQKREGNKPPQAGELAPLPVTSVDIPKAGKSDHEVNIIPYTDIAVITKHQIKVDFEKLDSDSSLIEQQLLQIAQEMQEKSDLAEFEWNKIKELEFQEKYKERNVLLSSLRSYQCTHCPDLIDHYGQLHVERILEQQVSDLAHTISDQNLELLPDYHQRIEVLKALQFIEQNNTVMLKGRMACEINTADELILTELILDNFFAEYEPAEIVALLSCFVFQEKSHSEPNLTSNLEKGIEKIKQTAIRIAEVQKKCGLDVRPEEAPDQLKFGLVEVVYEWANGLPFKFITDLTDVLEGSIVRCIVRLEETCREMRGCSRLMGDAKLFKKMELSSECIKRDIVFAASLYL